MDNPVVVGQSVEKVEVPPSVKLNAPTYKGRRLMSHSEVDIYNQCQRKHHFASEEKLQPKKRGVALGKGSAGHLYLETFLQAIKDGVEHSAAMDKALNKVAAEPFAADILPIVMYWAQNVWPTLGWKIIAVEYEFEPVDVAPGLAIPGKIDLIAEVYDEKLGWVIAVIDHKFLYDPYPPTVFQMLPQIPKYIGILRSKGMNVKMGMFNVMRTRKLNDPMERYVKFPVYPTNPEIRQHMIEQVSTMKQIDANSKNPDYIPKRTVNKMNCGHCGFLDLCQARLMGKDTTLLEKIDYETNTYGYSDKEIES